MPAALRTVAFPLAAATWLMLLLSHAAAAGELLCAPNMPIIFFPVLSNSTLLPALTHSRMYTRARAHAHKHRSLKASVNIALVCGACMCGVCVYSVRAR